MLFKQPSLEFSDVKRLFPNFKGVYVVWFICFSLFFLLKYDLNTSILPFVSLFFVPLKRLAFAYFSIYFRQS